MFPISVGLFVQSNLSNYSLMTIDHFLIKGNIANVARYEKQNISSRVRPLYVSCQAPGMQMSPLSQLSEEHIKPEKAEAIILSFFTFIEFGGREALVFFLNICNFIFSS